MDVTGFIFGDGDYGLRSAAEAHREPVILGGGEEFGVIVLVFSRIEQKYWDGVSDGQFVQVIVGFEAQLFALFGDFWEEVFEGLNSGDLDGIGLVV